MQNTQNRLPRRPSGQQGSRYGSSQAGRETSTISVITAPYNFVPLSSWVHIPDWSSAVSHDLPFEDGLCGELAIEITADTPILIGSEKASGSNAVHPYTFPDKRYAIPGASFKGMLRNVLEIATFGRMAAVDDQQFCLRDLSGPTRKDYQTKFADTVWKPDQEGNRQKAFAALPETGWLKYVDGKWFITPCEHARVDHDRLDVLLRPKDETEDTPGPFRQIAKSDAREAQACNGEQDPKLPILKYRRFTHALGQKFSKEPSWKMLHIRFDMDPAPVAQKHGSEERGNIKHLYYRKVTRVGNGTHVGHLVFTGQPGPKKHMEFMFYESGQPQQPVKLADEVISAFLALHNPAKESNSGRRPPASVVWDFYRRERPYGERGVPVFFLRENGQISSLGLAQMYRLPYKLTVGKAIGNTQRQPRHGEADFCEALFGHIAEDRGKGLRSRVAFGHAVAQDNVQPQALESTILNSPKASYFPNYIRQKELDREADRLRDRGQYTTLMQENAEIRGWKRYPVRGGHALQPLTPDQQKNRDIQTQLNPLPAGTRFEGRIRFHNLLPEELGALVWALTWGGAEHHRHAIGMGKAFGMGQVKLAIKSYDIRTNRENGPITTPEECRARFVEHMNTVHAAAHNQKGWRESSQIKSLLAMANPDIGQSQTLKHLTLDERRNQFAEVKKGSMILPEYPVEADARE